MAQSDERDAPEPAIHRLSLSISYDTRIELGSGRLPKGAEAEPGQTWQMVFMRTRSILIYSCRLALSGFWRNDLTADFAARIGLGMYVDVPLTGGKLLRLLGREGRLPLNRVFRGAALLAHPYY